MTVETVLQVVLIPILTALTAYAVKWINAKTAALKAQTDSQVAQKYLDMLNDTIQDCIIATNQTYVNALKKSGDFANPEAQKEAFNKTYNAVKSIITTEMEAYLKTAVGDLNEYINTRIESQVCMLKTQ